MRVNFDIAVFAYKLGYNEECDHVYEIGVEEPRKLMYYEGNYSSGMTTNQDWIPQDALCVAPTQSELQTWLRNTHRIHISPQYSTTRGGKSLGYVVSVFYEDFRKLGPFLYGQTYEETLNKGITEALWFMNLKPILKTNEDFKIFSDSVMNPPAPNEALIKAQEKYNEFRRENKSGPQGGDESEEHY